MINRFDLSEGQALADRYPDLSPDLALLVYTSRLLGREEELVLHGGGNTSVKLTAKNIFGETIQVLHVKGSGFDLAAIEPGGFVKMNLSELQKLRPLSHLSDRDLDNQLRVHKLEFDDPDPSVDTLVHAFLPHKYVAHAHADSILILTNQIQADRHLEQALGSKALILSYLMPGFPLAEQIARQVESHPDLEAVVVKNHGIFTFGNDPASVYGRMLEYVNRAETYIENLIRKRPSPPPIEIASPPYSYTDMARLAQTVRGHCAYTDPDGQMKRFFVEIRNGRETTELTMLPKAKDMCLSGVLIPDHVVWTKNEWVYLDHLPVDDEALTHLVSLAVRNYIYNYDEYSKTHLENIPVGTDIPDPYPRVFLVRGLGILALGETRTLARMTADIADHTLRAKSLAMVVGKYAPLDRKIVFKMEHWDRQQRKLNRKAPLPLQGQAAIVTGGAGAIAFGVADRLLHAGADVALADIDQGRLMKAAGILKERYGPERVETVVFDVTNFVKVEAALEDISLRFGGVDLIVPNAGLAYVAKIEDIDPDQLDRVTSVNFKGTFNIIKAAAPIFRRQESGGSIVLISSKNVFDPGASFAAYSASKAAAHQLAKIAAMELAEFGVRVNMINPDAIFGAGELTSKLWDLVGPDRMKSRGLKPEDMQEYYRARNLLKARVTAEHVGNAVVFFASHLTPTTGATLPVDGGVQNAFPR